MGNSGDGMGAGERGGERRGDSRTAERSASARDDNGEEDEDEEEGEGGGKSARSSRLRRRRRLLLGGAMLAGGCLVAGGVAAGAGRRGAAAALAAPAAAAMLLLATAGAESLLYGAADASGVGLLRSPSPRSGASAACLGGKSGVPAAVGEEEEEAGAVLRSLWVALDARPSTPYSHAMPTIDQSDAFRSAYSLSTV